MIQNKNVIYGAIVILFFAGLSVFIWNNYQVQVQEKPIKPIQLPPQISGKCGIESCHGLDIVCGPNVPEICTEMYSAGDNCRQYVSCKSINGQCKLEKTQKFDSCKSCVEKCEKNSQGDLEKFFRCEGNCAK